MLKYESRSWPGADDEHAPVDRDGRHRRAARVEDDDDPGAARPRARAPASTFETKTWPASPPPARRQPIVGTPGHRRELEVVGGGVAARAREGDEVGDRRTVRSTSSGSGGPPRPIADHDHVAVAREPATQGARRRRSSRRACPRRSRAIDGHRELLETRRVEAKVGADVGEPGRKRARGPAEPLARAEHRLVREVDDQPPRRRSRSSSGTP